MAAIPMTPDVDETFLVDATSAARKSPAFDNHERVWRIQIPSSGLLAFIAIHDTTLGPALGGCRMWPYGSENEAMTDVLRLSTGMTFKAALAGLKLGGGKAVIVGDPNTDKTASMLREFATMVDRLGGAYITAEDVGISIGDVDIMAERTTHVVGTSRGRGDPSPMTALGVCEGIKAAVKHRLGADSLRGLTIAVQGVGQVGFDLCRRLSAEGADLFISDIDTQSVSRAVEMFGASAVDPDRIHATAADVFSPNALGAVINDDTIADLRCAVVAGGANNQLAGQHHGASLHERGILYAPDYVINAGGLISVASEAAGSVVDDARVSARVKQIGSTLSEIFSRSREESRAPELIAERLATDIVSRQRR